MSKTTTQQTHEHSRTHGHNTYKHAGCHSLFDAIRPAAPPHHALHCWRIGTGGSHYSKSAACNLTNCTVHISKGAHRAQYTRTGSNWLHQVHKDTCVNQQDVVHVTQYRKGGIPNCRIPTADQASIRVLAAPRCWQLKCHQVTTAGQPVTCCCTAGATYPHAGGLHHTTCWHCHCAKRSAIQHASNLC